MPSFESVVTTSSPVSRVRELHPFSSLLFRAGSGLPQNEVPRADNIHPTHRDRRVRSFRSCPWRKSPKPFSILSRSSFVQPSEPKKSDAQFELVVRYSHIVRDFAHVHGIRRSAYQNGRAEIVKHSFTCFSVLPLETGITPAPSFQVRSEARAHLKSPYPERDLCNVVISHADCRTKTRNAVRPHIKVIAGITDDRGIAGRARRGVNADNLFHRLREKSVRVIVPDVAFFRYTVCIEYR